LITGLPSEIVLINIQIIEVLLRLLAYVDIAEEEVISLAESFLNPNL